MRHLLEFDPGADEGDEGRRADGQATLARSDVVAHLVQEEQRDEARGVAPAIDEGVGDDRQQHRAAGGQQLAELEELQAAEEPQQQFDHGPAC